MLVTAAEILTSNECQKNKILDQEDKMSCDSIRSSIDTMLLMDQFGKIMGINEETLYAMKKDTSFLLQLVNWFESMQRDMLLSSKDTQVSSDFSPIGETSSVNEEMSPNYALGSCYLPRTNSISPEYAIRSVPERLSPDEMGPIVAPGLYHSPKENGVLVEEDTSKNKCTGESFEQGMMIFHEDNLMNPSDDDDSISMEGEEELSLHDFLPFCDQITSSNTLNANVECDHETQFECSPSSCYSEISEKPQYTVSPYNEDASSEDDPFSYKVSPVLPGDQQLSPLPETQVLENISVKDSTRSSCASSKKSKDGSAQFSKDLSRTVLGDGYFHLLDNHLPSMKKQHFPVSDHSLQIDHLSVKSLGSSLHSTVKDSTSGSNGGYEVTMDLLDIESMANPSNDEAKEDLDTGPSRKSRKIDHSHLAVIPNLSETNDFESCPVNNMRDSLFSQRDDKFCSVFERDLDGDLPLHLAVAHENLLAVRQCLKLMRGNEIDALNRDQQSPLHIACYLENIAIMEILLQYGANPEQVDSAGNNMMHLGCMIGSTIIMELLGAHFEAMPNKLHMMLSVRNYEGLCPLHVSVKMKMENMDQNAEEKSTAVVKYLLHNFNCDLNVKELKGGRTVLMMAIQGQDWDLFDLFISCGADPNISSHADLFALDYVAHTDNLEVAENLINRGALSGRKNDFNSCAMKTLFDNDKRKRRQKGRKRSKALRKEWDL